MKNLIAFVGFKSSGKNTAALPLIANGYTSLSFADSLKDALASIFCWDRQLLEGVTEESRIWREQIDVWWAEKLGIPHFTPRWMMMNFGTQIMRQQFHDSIWLFNIERRIATMDKPVVLTDCRFPNEIKMAGRYNGKIVRIKRGPEPSWLDTARLACAGSSAHILKLKELGVHESEWSWIGTFLGDVIENDGSIEELHSKVIEKCLT